MKARKVAVAVIACTGAIGASLAMAGGLKESKKTVPVAFNEQKSVVAKCSGKKHVAWGGFKGTVNGDLQQASTKVYTFGMVPEEDDVDRMVVDADNGSPPPGDEAKITSYAYCFEGKKPKVTVNSTNVPDDDEKGASAGCPEGKTLIGGGFSTEPFVNTQGPHMTIEYLGRPGSGEAYQASITNVSGEALELTVYAICGKGPRPEEVAGPNKSLDNGDPETAKSNCPDGEKVMFGGLNADYDEFDGISMPIGMYQKGNAVEVLAIGDFSSEQNFRAIAYCR